MFNNIEIDQGIHQKYPFFIITFLWKINLIIVQISKKCFETTVYFVNYRPEYFLLFIKNLIHDLILTS